MYFDCYWNYIEISKKLLRIRCLNLKCDIDSTVCEKCRHSVHAYLLLVHPIMVCTRSRCFMGAELHARMVTRDITLHAGSATWTLCSLHSLHSSLHSLHTLRDITLHAGSATWTLCSLYSYICCYKQRIVTGIKEKVCM